MGDLCLKKNGNFNHWAQCGVLMQEFLDAAQRGYAPLDAANKRLDLIVFLLYEIALELRSR